MQIQDKELLLIGLREEAERIVLSPLDMGKLWLEWYIGNRYQNTPVTDGYELIGIWPDITEQQAQKAVDIINDLKDVVPGECYENYVEPDRYTNTALESLATRMQKAGALTENPYGQNKPRDAFELEVNGLKTRSWGRHEGGYYCAECCNGDRCDEDCTAVYRGRRKDCPHCKGNGHFRESEVKNVVSRSDWQEAEARVFVKWGILRRKEVDNDN